MKHLSTETKQQLDWRRSKVLELSSQGYSEREIAEVLKVNDTAVHRDLVYLRQQAQENLQRHIHEVVPAEYQKCMVGMKLPKFREAVYTSSMLRQGLVFFLDKSKGIIQ
jgi:predicted transcriptional regulator